MCVDTAQLPFSSHCITPSEYQEPGWHEKIKPFINVISKNNGAYSGPLSEGRMSMGYPGV